jgi:hypothetical protein
MAWIFAAVVLLLMVYVPKFRVLTGWVAASCVFLGLGTWAYFEWSERHAKTLIRPSEVLLEDIRFRRSGSAWFLSGRLRNGAPQHTLSRVSLEVLIKDCPTIDPPLKLDKSMEELEQWLQEKRLREELGTSPASYPSSAKCDVVGQKEVSIFLDVPSGQVRNFDEEVYLPAGTQVHGTMDWQYRLLQTAAH